MTYMYRDERDAESPAEGFERLLEEMEQGDCLVVERFSGAARNVKGFLSLMNEMDSRGIRFKSMEEGFDTGTDQGKYTLGILKALSQLEVDYRREKQREGIHNAKEEGKYKGRKPIEVDDDIFDSILERWRSGEITARQAMNELGLKPNTFYRRVKERMTESKNGEALWDAAKQLGKEFVVGMAAETEELQEAAGKIVSEVESGSVTEQITKNLSAAGAVFNRYVNNLSRDFQEAMKEQSPEPPKEEPQFTEDSDEDKEWI